MCAVNRPKVHSKPNKNQLCFIQRSIHFGTVALSLPTHLPKYQSNFADSKFYFCCLKKNHPFRQCTAPRKCSKDGCSSSHNIPVEIGFFLRKQRQSNWIAVCSGIGSVIDAKVVLQIVELEVHTTTTSNEVLASCDSACSHFWFSENLAIKLKLRGSPTDLAVH